MKMPFGNLKIDVQEIWLGQINENKRLNRIYRYNQR